MRRRRKTRRRRRRNQLKNSCENPKTYFHDTTFTYFKLSSPDMSDSGLPD
jgi:hypothetical protein